MAYDFSLTPLQNMEFGVGSEENAILGREYSQLNKTTRISDLNVTKVYQENTAKCVNKEKLDAALAKKETSAQIIYYDDFARSTPSAGNSLQQTGFGTGATRRNQIPIGSLLTQKMSITRENLKQWDFLGGDEDPNILRMKLGLAMQDAMLEMYMTLLQRTEDAVVAHLFANIATGGGAGTEYTAVGNIKEITDLQSSTKYRGMRVEARQNRFLYGSNNTPYLLSSSGDDMYFGDLEARSVYNETNQKGTQLDASKFNFRSSISLDAAAVSAGYESISFMIKEGGVGFASYVPSMGWDALVPEMKVENAVFEKITMGDFTSMGIPVGEGLQDMNFGLYMEKSVLNTNGVYGNEASYIDKGINMTLFTQPVIFAAPLEASAIVDKPIVQYGQLAPVVTP